MEFTGDKAVVDRSAKLFAALGGVSLLVGVAYFVITKFTNMLLDVIIGAIIGIVIGATYGSLRYVFRGSSPRVIIDGGFIVKEDIKKEKIPIADIQKLEKRGSDLVIHTGRRKLVISSLMGYPVEKIQHHLKRTLRKIHSQ